MITGAHLHEAEGDDEAHAGDGAAAELLPGGAAEALSVTSHKTYPESPPGSVQSGPSGAAASVFGTDA
eukprot:88042-Pyramimonas_sp.AAC.1